MISNLLLKMKTNIFANMVGVYNGLYVLDTDGVGSPRHFMQGINVHCITEFGAERHLVGSDRGIQLLDENSTDLILTDVMMPGMHGDEWCRQLKSIPHDL